MDPVIPSIAGVVVNYNYARYLVRAIQSLLVQQRHFAEVILVDDGSTDDSLEVAKAFDERVVIIAKDNGGQLSACLAGLQVVQSEYVYFLDADDVALPQLVSRVSQELAASPVKVQFQLQAVNAVEEPTGSIFPNFPTAYDAEQMRRDIVIAGVPQTPPTSGNVYRRDTLLALDTSALDLRDFIDGPITFAMPYLGSIAVIQEPLALYRVHGGNHSQWFSPTPELLRHEVKWFGDRWRQTCALLGSAETPFDGTTPGYVLEHELLIAALERPGWLAGPAVRYARSLHRTCAPRASVLALQAWALALVIPWPSLRRYLVQQRRAAAERPWLVRAAVSLLRRSRR